MEFCRSEKVGTLVICFFQIKATPWFIEFRVRVASSFLPKTHPIVDDFALGIIARSLL